MTTSQGLGRQKPPVFRNWAPWTNLLSLNETAKTVAEDFYWGGSPPQAVEIPYAWLRPPVRIRQDAPFNVAEVSQQLGATARSVNDASVAATGREWRFRESIDSVAPADAPNFAQWMTDFYDIARPRMAQVSVLLNPRTETEIWQILSVTQGRRISITGAPAGWPTGATELVVEGVRHVLTGLARLVTWNTAPIIGVNAGQAGPWFYSDRSRTNGTDVVPF